MSKSNGLYAPLIAIAMTGTAWAEDAKTTESTTEGTGRTEDMVFPKSNPAKKSDTLRRSQSSRKLRKRGTKAPEKTKEAPAPDSGTSSPGSGGGFEQTPVYETDAPTA